MQTVGFLGPKGTYTEKASISYFGEQDVQFIPFRTIPDIFKAVKDRRVVYGVVPIENSIEGSVNQTLDLLAREKDIEIYGETILPVRHALMARAGLKILKIKKIFSHSQALAQSSDFIFDRMPEIQLVETASTAEAAEKVSRGPHPNAAVIGHPDLAELYDLNIVEPDISNCASNITRFIVIGSYGLVRGEADKISILLSITDRPGGLYQALKEFALKNINLTKIESRPTKNGLGNYMFFIDFMGSVTEREVADCLRKIREITASLRVLGCYRGADNNRVEVYDKKEVSLEQIREDIDIIDRQIVELLAKRTELVNLVGTIKGSSAKVRDKERETRIIERLTREAADRGVSPQLIKQLYGILFKHFVGLQESQRKKIKKTGVIKRK